MSHPGNKKKSAQPTHQTELPQYGVGQRHPAVAAWHHTAPETPRRRVQEEPQGRMAPTRLQMGPPPPSYQVQSLGDAHNANEALYAQTPVYMNQPEQAVFQGQYMHTMAPAPVYMGDNPEGPRGPVHQVAAMSTETTEATTQKRSHMVRWNGEHDKSEDGPSYSAGSIEEPVTKKHKGKGKEPVMKKHKGKGKATTATHDPSPGSSGQSSTIVDVGEDDLGPTSASSLPASPLRTTVSSLTALMHAILNVLHAIDKLTMLMGMAHSVPTSFSMPLPSCHGRPRANIKWSMT
ncbi:hypothetical protein K466DRAFT_566593 [Polyporus arcularius HHB13444]|uniref:Uncharacterized protein n=1 Tax=Polyporus arcularius HHB13444 TaxID=1314778 RepID=A0A5C3P741_9APHY|nr:hypothetical protein K466DRAFT_566593 [Polyporus arcularius HHB13444]